MATTSTDDGNHYTEILQHRIKFWLRGDDAPTELDETSEEHITELIRQGYNQGELLMTDASGADFRGWWSIEN